MYRTIQDALQSGRMVISPHPFLCTASAGWEMPLSLAQILDCQDLAIAKGDANYRRLVGDLHWPYETPRERVLEYLSFVGVT